MDATCRTKRVPRLSTLFMLPLLACATSATGRTQLQLMSPNETAGMGHTAFEQIKQEQEAETDPEVNRYVRCVAEQITAVVDGGKGQWEVVTFRDPSANAFALPGGKIGVHTGLLQVAKTQGQLAAVLGHEVAHVTQSHANERISQAVVTQGGVQAVLAALGSEKGTSHDLAMAALGVGAQLGVLMPYGRLQESEADVVGLQYMAQAGFEPREAVRLWQNMEAQSGGSPPEFLSSHPSHKTRIRGLQERMPSATEQFESARQSGRNPKCTPPPLPAAPAGPTASL